MAFTDKFTAIANAIRGKTGKTDGLTLEQMATEIDWIVLGSQIATGTFTLTTPDAFTSYSSNVTISGIPFKPKNIIAYRVGATLTTGENYLYFVDTTQDGIRYCYGGNSFVDTTQGYYSVEMTNDGFKLKILTAKYYMRDESKYRYNYIYAGTWNYIAIS